MFGAFETRENSEDLRDFFLKSRTPVDIRSVDRGSVRQPLGKPTSDVPSGKRPIPSSTARPGPGVNECIVYTRENCQTIEYASNHPRVASSRISVGDIVFVSNEAHHAQRARVLGAAAPVKVATMAQLNAVVDPKMTALVERKTCFPSDLFFLNVLSHLPIANGKFNGCNFFGEWRPDGVVKTADGEPQTCLNIAVAGPTLLRNTPPHVSHGLDMHQTIDQTMAIMDTVYVAIVLQFHFKPQDLASFKYICFTSRQYMNADLTAIPGNDGVPSPDDFRKIVHVWKIGKILDTAASRLGEGFAKLNVCIEEINVEEFCAMHNKFCIMPYFTENEDDEKRTQAVQYFVDFVTQFKLRSVLRINAQEVMTEAFRTRREKDFGEYMHSKMGTPPHFYHTREQQAFTNKRLRELASHCVKLEDERTQLLQFISGIEGDRIVYIKNVITQLLTVEFTIAKSGAFEKTDVIRTVLSNHDLLLLILALLFITEDQEEEEEEESKMVTRRVRKAPKAAQVNMEVQKAQRASDDGNRKSKEASKKKKKKKNNNTKRMDQVKAQGGISATWIGRMWLSGGGDDDDEEEEEEEED